MGQGNYGDQAYNMVRVTTIAECFEVSVTETEGLELVRARHSMSKPLQRQGFWEMGQRDGSPSHQSESESSAPGFNTK